MTICINTFSPVRYKCFHSTNPLATDRMRHKVSLLKLTSADLNSTVFLLQNWLPFHG